VNEIPPEILAKAQEVIRDREQKVRPYPSVSVNPSDSPGPQASANLSDSPRPPEANIGMTGDRSSHTDFFVVIVVIDGGKITDCYIGPGVQRLPKYLSKEQAR
jgi:hypothetical protein